MTALGDVDLIAWAAAAIAVVGIAAARDVVGGDRYAVNPVWPAVGAGAATLVLVSARWFVPTVAVVAFYLAASAAIVGLPIADALLVSFGGVAASVVAALVLRQHGVVRIDDVDSVLALGVAAAASGGVIAIGGTGATFLVGHDVRFALVAGLASTAAILSWLPLLLHRPPQAPAVITVPGRRARPVGACVTLTVAACAMAVVPSNEVARALGSVGLLAALSWSAIRLGIRATSAQVAGFSILGALVWAVGEPLNPPALRFTDAYLNDIELAWAIGVFVVVAAVWSLALGALGEQRRVLADVVHNQQRFADTTSSEVGLGRIVTTALSSSDVPRIAEINPVAARMLGADTDTIRGTPLSDWLDLGDDVTAPTLISNAPTNRGITSSWRLATWRGQGISRTLAETFEVRSAVYLTEHNRLAASLTLLRQRGSQSDTLHTVMDRATVDEAEDLFVVCALDGVVQYSNFTASRLLNHHPQDTTDHYFWELAASGDERELMRQLWGDPLEDGLPPQRDLVCGTSPHRRRIRWTWNLLGHEDNPDGIVAVGTDITDDNVQADLLDLILRSTESTLILLLDTTGVITTCNSGAETTLKATHADLVGTNVLAMLEPTGLPLWTATSASPTTSPAAAPTGSPDPIGVRPVEALGGRAAPLLKLLAARSDQTRWLLTTRNGATAETTAVIRAEISTLSNNAERSIGYVFVGQDVSKAERLQAELERAVDAAQQSVRRLERLGETHTRFISTASHELRTPATNILGRIELLQDGTLGNLTPAQQKIVDTLTRNITRLVNVINDLVALNEIDGLDPQTFTTINLAALTRAALRAEQARTGADLERFQVTIGDSPNVLGPHQLLTNAVTQLIRNAIRFSEPHTPIDITLHRVRHHDTTNAHDHSVLTITDQGHGIPSDDLDHIFDRFYRGAHAHHHAIQGNGIGLAIAQAAAHAMAGQITVLTTPGHGSAFSLHLPTEPA